MRDAEPDASNLEPDRSGDPPPGAALGSDPFERVLGRGRGACGDSDDGGDPPRRAPDGAELFRRFGRSLVGSDLSTSEFGTLLARAGVFALRGSLHTSPNQVRPLIITSAHKVDLEDPIPMALVLCELDASGCVKSALIFPYDSEVST